MDGTKCEGKDCPFKEECYRFTAPVNEYGQSYRKIQKKTLNA